MKTLIYLATFLFSQISLAGGTLGNGGNVLICPEQITLLDFYESESLRNISITQGSTKNSLQENMEIILNQFSKQDPKRAEKYLLEWKRFFSETLFVTNTNIGTIDDSDHVFIPTNCYVQQTAIKLLQRFPQDPKYVIDQDTWDQMDSVQKAGLIMHELIYGEMNHSTSQKARYMNSLLWSDIWIQMTPEQYQNLLKEVGLNP